MDVGCGGRPRGIYIYLNDYKNKLTSKDYVNRIVIPQNSSAKIINQQKYFKDLDAVVAEGFSGMGSPGLVAFIAKETNIIELFSDGIAEATANKIFSTFKFLP